MKDSDLADWHARISLVLSTGLHSVVNAAMGETGMRSRQERAGNSEGRNNKRRHDNKDNLGDRELVLYRILCPNGAIGGVIGHNGQVINSIRQATHAKIKVADPSPGVDMTVITIHCYVNHRDFDAPDVSTKPLCSAQDALLKVHAAIANKISNRKDKKETYMLAPNSQAQRIVGKSGVKINWLRYKTKASIEIYPKCPEDTTYSCAMSFDNYVQISGDAEAVKRALFAVSAVMYKFPPKEEIPLNAAVAVLPSTTIIPSDAPVYPAGSFDPSVDVIVPPSESPPHVPGSPGYTDTGGGQPMYSFSPPVASGCGGPSQSAELVLRVLCPPDKIGVVIGKGGSTINSIRQASGARIVVDSKKNSAEGFIITVTSTESNEDVRSAALEAVLQLQEKINGEDIDTANVRLLVPPKVVHYLVGKNGSVIDDMRIETEADIRISKGGNPERAAPSDELVEVIGEVCNVLEAVVQIVIRLREYAFRYRDGGGTDDAPSV